MKRLLVWIVLIAAGLLLMPLAVKGVSAQDSTGPPPVAQTLVREGDFAVKLANALNLGTFENEADAEDALVSKGIAPRNGWIADYPVTPDIVDELRSSIESAADADQLPMGKYTATKAFEDVTVEVGIPVVAGTQWDYERDSSTAEYTDPTVVNNYYYNEGPPVVTYYAPPWDYHYLYNWVSYPFWHASFFFPGFFVLRDFHRVVVVKRNFNNRFVINRVSNRVFDRVNRRTAVINPVNRRTGQGLRTVSDIRRGRDINTGRVRDSAASIVRRSNERGRSQIASVDRTNRGALNRQQPLSSRSNITSQERTLRGENRNIQNRDDRRVARVNPAAPERSLRRSTNEFRSRDRSGSSQGLQRNFESRSQRSLGSRPQSSLGRSFSGSSSERKSFNAPRGGGGSSFRSFSGSGRSGGGFSQAGRAGGGSSGGRGGGRSGGGGSGRGR